MMRKPLGLFHIETGNHGAIAMESQSSPAFAFAIFAVWFVGFAVIMLRLG